MNSTLKSIVTAGKNILKSVGEGIATGCNAISNWIINKRIASLKTKLSVIEPKLVEVKAKIAAIKLELNRQEIIETSISVDIELIVREIETLEKLIK